MNNTIKEYLDIGNHRAPKTGPSEVNRAIIDSKRADRNVYYCIKCDYCWEYESKRSKKSRYLTYKHFPTFKKKRILCPKHQK